MGVLIMTTQCHSIVDDIMLTIYLCVLLLSLQTGAQEDILLEKGREIISMKVYTQKTIFRCKFSIFERKNNVVSIKQSSVSCWPKKKRGYKNKLEIRGRKGVYVASFSINPSKLRMLVKKTSFGCFDCTEGPVITPLLQRLATFAANNPSFPFPPTLGNCTGPRSAEVVEVSPHSTADYMLTLAVSALSGSLCRLVLTSLCYNVSVSALCEAGAECYQLVSADNIICRRGTIKPIG